MSLNSDSGPENGPEQKKQDGLLPLDFPEGTQQPQRKPIPLGSFMKNSGPAAQDGQQERKPIPLVARKAAPDAAQDGQQERKPIPLVAKKAEVSAAPEPAAPTPQAPAEMQPAAPTGISEASQPVQTKEQAKPEQESARAPQQAVSPEPPPAAASSLASAAEEPEPPPAKPAPPEPSGMSQAGHAEAASHAAKRFDTQPKSFSEKRPLQSMRKSPSAPKQEPAKPKRRPIKLGGSAALQNSSVGQILQEARVASGLSLIQVEQLTRIKRDYLEGLECDNAAKLPPSVFVSAYVRTLSSVYNLDPEDIEILQSKLKRLGSQHELPEKLMQDIEKDGQINVAEETRVRKIFICVGGGLLSLAVLSLLWYGLLLWKRPSETVSRSSLAARTVQGVPAPSPVAGAFRPEQLERFIIPQSLSMRELKLPSAPRGAGR